MEQMKTGIGYPLMQGHTIPNREDYFTCSNTDVDFWQVPEEQK